MPNYTELPTRIAGGEITVNAVKEITSKRTGKDYVVMEFTDSTGKAQCFAKDPDYQEVLRGLPVGKRVKLTWAQGSKTPSVEHLA